MRLRVWLAEKLRDLAHRLDPEEVDTPIWLPHAKRTELQRALTAMYKEHLDSLVRPGAERTGR